ncbi:MAG: DNA lyase [Acidobacteria bacterium]|nr:DNA lyase [Acidobacteriota bacterium]MBV9069357.1 DNA lyase [Acidobacteriota bacterium]MBV9187151.1 DNA lyase [Acidobacteriota bacterium]
MRLWSLHPQYLDAKGLVALWREGLLAQAVLAGQTRGYRNHPQLERFRGRAGAIAFYLHHVADEAEARGYSFDRSKLPRRKFAPMIDVSDGQLRFEWQHLVAKLRERDPARLLRFAEITDPLPHPFFAVVPGSVAAWEKVHG